MALNLCFTQRLRHNNHIWWTVNHCPEMEKFKDLICQMLDRTQVTSLILNCSYCKETISPDKMYNSKLHLQLDYTLSSKTTSIEVNSAWLKCIRESIFLTNNKNVGRSYMKESSQGADKHRVFRFHENKRHAQHKINF